MKVNYDYINLKFLTGGSYLRARFQPIRLVYQFDHLLTQPSYVLVLLNTIIA